MLGSGGEVVGALGSGGEDRQRRGVKPALLNVATLSLICNSRIKNG